MYDGTQFNLINPQNSGRWITPAFSAGDFTANGSMTWTVAAGDVTTYAYTIDGKRMTVVFTLVNTTVGGTPNTTLQIVIPASKTATKTVSNAVWIDDNTTGVIGYATVTASGTTIGIKLMAGGNFGSGGDTTDVQGQITFEIN